MKQLGTQPAFCPYCGNHLAPGLAYCPYCGNRLASINPPIQRIPQQMSSAIHQEKEESSGVRGMLESVFAKDERPKEERRKDRSNSVAKTLVVIGIIVAIVTFGLPELRRQTERDRVSELSDDPEDYSEDLTYEELERKPDKYKGKLVKFTGSVVQVVKEASMVEIRLATKMEYSVYVGDVVYCSIPKELLEESRLLVGDVITVYGEANGIKEYTAVLGNEVKIPYILVRMIATKQL